MTKRIMVFVLCFSLMIVSIQAYASTSSSTSKSQQNLNNANSTVNELEDEQESIKSDISASESKLEELMNSVSALEVSLGQKEDEIGQAQEDLAAAEEKQEIQYEAMKLRIQYMYENGSSLSYVSTFLEAGSFSDMLNRINYISEVYSFDRDLLAEYGETTKKIADIKVGLESEMAELKDMQASYVAQQESLETELVALQEQSEDYENQITQAKAAAAEYQAQLLAAQAAAARNTSSGTQANAGGLGNWSNTGSGGSSYSSLTGINPAYTTGVSASSVIDYAKQFLGNPYVYGGTDINNGIDCSAYVQYVFAHFGISMPRTSYADRSVGSQVSLDCMAPGDIVCFNGHVAIYIGNDQIIHARGTAYGIMITTLNYRSDIITVRRVL